MMNITEAIRGINLLVRKTHDKQLTMGFGQMLVYKEKVDEAIDYVIAGYPNELNDYPLIQAESLAVHKPANIIADNILIKKSQWIAKCVQIESIKFSAKYQMKQPDADIAIIYNETITALNQI